MCARHCAKQHRCFLRHVKMGDEGASGPASNARGERRGYLQIRTTRYMLCHRARSCFNALFKKVFLRVKTNCCCCTKSFELVLTAMKVQHGRSTAGCLVLTPYQHAIIKVSGNFRIYYFLLLLTTPIAESS